jgi:hypothetical protein
MIPGLKIEFTSNGKVPEVYSQFTVDENCKCYWLEDSNQILVTPINHIPNPINIKSHAILISFDFIRCLDPDGGHEWLDKKLKQLIVFLIKNKTYFFD